MVSSGATGYDRKVWESLSHFYEVDAWLPRNYMLINSDVWEGVSEANKNVINACAGMAEYAGTWRAKEYTGFTLAGLRAAPIAHSSKSPSRQSLSIRIPVGSSNGAGGACHAPTPTLHQNRALTRYFTD